MASGRPQRPNDPGVMSSLESAVREIQRPGLIESAWNWRWELGIAAVAGGLSAVIATDLGLIWLAVITGAGLAAFGALMRWPPARRRIVTRTWCIITPHRIRAGCVNAWVQCRAGITAADLLAARDILAASCWAAEVRVIPSARHAHIVTLEVIRNHYPERSVQSPQDWPFYRNAEADAAGEDSEEPALVDPWGEPTRRSG